jgi:hypothetical protein
MSAEQENSERRTRWSFGCRDNNTWFWQLARSDGSIEVSAARLETLADALRDATAHGFVIWSRGEDRRREETDRLIEKVADTVTGKRVH